MSAVSAWARIGGLCSGVAMAALRVAEGQRVVVDHRDVDPGGGRPRRLRARSGHRAAGAVGVRGYKQHHPGTVPELRLQAPPHIQIGPLTLMLPRRLPMVVREWGTCLQRVRHRERGAQPCAAIRLAVCRCRIASR